MDEDMKHTENDPDTIRRVTLAAKWIAFNAAAVEYAKALKAVYAKGDGVDVLTADGTYAVTIVKFIGPNVVVRFTNKGTLTIAASMIVGHPVLLK